MTKQALGAYNNPFVLPPRYAFATEQQEPASYSAERHEILLSHEFEYWHCWVRLFVGRMRRAINEARIDPRAMPWQMLGQRMR
jgi:hypothetical protein